MMRDARLLVDALRNPGRVDTLDSSQWTELIRLCGKPTAPDGLWLNIPARSC